MAEFLRISRRLFLARVGKASMALAVLTACGNETGEPASTMTIARTTTTADSAAPTSTGTTAKPPTEVGSYRRVDLGFVSAYVVVRGVEAAVIDTGVAGSEGAIEAALETADLNWSAVGHLILTHRHPDHVGSMPAVMNAAAAATGYIGEADLDNVTAPRELVAVRDGDEVFGLQVIGTPGHTAGHISLLDPLAGVLVAGDAINGADGGVVGPNPDFSEDHTQALETVEKMAGYDYETIYFGHGEPVLEQGSSLVKQLLTRPDY